jgi:DNA-binding MarR family transcriptional regulator
MMSEKQIWIGYPGDAGYYVIMPAEFTPPMPLLTKKQQAVFDALKSAADVNNRARISQRRIADMTGQPQCSVYHNLWTLEKKGYLRRIKKPTNMEAAVYEIYE